MADGTPDLSGRFLRVPVEWVDRELHPWMESSAWRETYERLQRNGSWQRHTAYHGRQKYVLEEHQLLVSVAWLCECCPDLTEKSARILLTRLEEEGLISWPHGKTQGARVQILQLEHPWRDAKGELKKRKGRTRKSRKRRRSKDSDDSSAEEGRTHDGDGASSEGAGANSSGGGANSGTEIEPPSPPGANSSEAVVPGSVRGFGWHQPGEGRTRGSPHGGGDTEGEAEGESNNGNPPSLSSLPPTKRRDLVKQAANYCAPSRDGVLPLGGKEMRQLEDLMGDLCTSKRLGPAGLRDFFRAARRWADEEVGTDRINANFIRPNIHAIQAFQNESRQAEEAREARKDELSKQRRRYEEEQEMASWTAQVSEALEAEPESVRATYLEAALKEVSEERGETLTEGEAVPPWIRLNARAKALQNYAEDHDLPEPPGE